MSLRYQPEKICLKATNMPSGTGANGCRDGLDSEVYRRYVQMAHLQNEAERSGTDGC